MQQDDFLLEEKVKQVKMGRMKKEGCLKKVFSILECQVETRAMMRPGSSTTDTATENIEKHDLDRSDPTKQNVSNIFPSSVVRLA